MQPLSLSDSPKSSSFEPGFRPFLSRWRSRSRFWIRLRHWEYWPFELVYFPIFVYWLWLSLKARSFFFFSASNPAIESGGLLGESKWDILSRIDKAYKPKTIFVSTKTDAEEVLNRLQKAGMRFPVIAKPDVGERGWRVKKIEKPDELRAYAFESPGDFLVQAYVDEPLELGVFYYRMPGQAQGTVSSIVQKEFLTVRGNGHNCIEELIGQNERAFLQLPALRERYGDFLHVIPAAGETIPLEPIGNHSRGTKFLNANHLITPELTAVIDRISQSIDGFYYGRYDLRCRSLADLQAGRTIQILELNGAGAEPGHIYQPGFSLWEAYKVLFRHWRVLYAISRENHRWGVPYMTLREAYRLWKKHSALK
ncbi:hypothetical protein ACO2Q8_09465 [Larkinella sp. VNQ87]|uniref:hypothetical protein n=1 Tax=Larkinella sp. VNQ87 TaxID=3400921 RepID=UPI003C0EB2BE